MGSKSVAARGFCFLILGTMLACSNLRTTFAADAGTVDDGSNMEPVQRPQQDKEPDQRSLPSEEATTNRLLEDMMAERDHTRQLSSWGAGGGRLSGRNKISATYSKSSKETRRRHGYIPKYGRRYYDPYLNHDSDDRYNAYDDEYESEDEEIEGVTCISLANKKYRKHKKSTKGKKFHHYKHRQSGKEKGYYSKSKAKGSKGSKSRSRSKSKSYKRREYFDYCEEEIPVDEIICSANIQDFQSSVGLLFSGNPQFLTGPEQLALENSFEDTYNELTFANCDGYFRRIESVSLFVPGERRERRRLDEEDEMDSSTSSSTNSSLATVTGTCRECPVSSAGSFSLFDDSFRRRRLQQFTDDAIGSSDLTSDAGTGADVCTCPEQGAGRMLQLRQEDLEPNAPSEEDFLFAYNQDIERLVDEGVVTNVDSIMALEEVPIEEEVEVLCSPDIQDFLTYVLVSFNGDGTAMSDMESAILSILFEQVYNDLSFDNCDGYFRMTDDTTLIRPTATSPGYFEVAATCRDCPVNGAGWFSIFANMRRALAEDRATQSFQTKKTPPSRVRGLQRASGDVCLCPALSNNIDDPDPAAPSMNALERELNRRISELRRTGMINNIVSLSILTETPTMPQGGEEELPETEAPTGVEPPETEPPTVADQPPEPETAEPTVMEPPPPKTMMPTKLDMPPPPPKTAMPTTADVPAFLTDAPTFADPNTGVGVESPVAGVVFDTMLPTAATGLTPGARTGRLDNGFVSRSTFSPTAFTGLNRGAGAGSIDSALLGTGSATRNAQQPPSAAPVTRPPTSRPSKPPTRTTGAPTATPTFGPTVAFDDDDDAVDDDMMDTQFPTTAPETGGNRGVTREFRGSATPPRRRGSHRQRRRLRRGRGYRHTRK